MPNVHLTDQMKAYVQSQIESGAYANLSEVVRAGIRLLMETDGARQFYALKADLEQAAFKVAEGDSEPFDPLAFEPEGFQE